MKAHEHSKRGVVLSVIFATVAIGGSWLAPAAPLLEYAFNETGTTAPSTGTETTSLAIYNAANVATDLHGAAGSGVSGVSTDRCLDFSSALGMGSSPGSADVDTRHSADLEAIDTLQSFTLSGWYKTSVPDATIGGYAVLFDNAPNSPVTSGFRLSCAGANLSLEVDNGSVASSGNAFDDKNRWVFFAVSYDGTASASNVRFYRGYRTSYEAHKRPVLSCVFTGTVDKATLENDTMALHVGNRSTRLRPFKGYLDNMRIHGSKTDATGALSASQLEALRAADTADVFDPRLLLAYTFDETGTTAASSGFCAYPLNLLSSGGVATDYHGAAGSGVSGRPEDRSLDFSSATAWGNLGTGPTGVQAADYAEVDVARSFTISGWFKTAPGSTIDRYAKILTNESTTDGYELVAQAGQLIFDVDKIQVSAPYGETGKWVFFGVTYDGSLTTNNVLFYKGFRTSREAGGSPAVSCISTSTINKGDSGDNTSVVGVGNVQASPYNRPFKGGFDNLRLHASYHGSDGALSQAQLEALRAADYNVPPAETILLVR